TIVPGAPLDARTLRVEEASAILAFGACHVLRVHRHLEDGPTAELEIGRFLMAHGRRVGNPAWTATLSYRAGRGEPSTVATLQSYVSAESDAWKLARDQLRQYYERVLARGPESRPELPPPGDDTTLLDQEPPAAMHEAV